MLAEGFLRLLCYREERKFVSKQKEKQKSSSCSDLLRCAASDPNAAGSQMISAEAGKKKPQHCKLHERTKVLYSKIKLS